MIKILSVGCINLSCGFCKRNFLKETDCVLELKLETKLMLTHKASICNSKFKDQLIILEWLK